MLGLCRFRGSRGRHRKTGVSPTGEPRPVVWYSPEAKKVNLQLALQLATSKENPLSPGLSIPWIEGIYNLERKKVVDNVERYQKSDDACAPP